MKDSKIRSNIKGLTVEQYIKKLEQELSEAYDTIESLEDDIGCKEFTIEMLEGIIDDLQESVSQLMEDDE